MARVPPFAAIFVAAAAIALAPRWLSSVMPSSWLQQFLSPCSRYNDTAAFDNISARMHHITAHADADALGVRLLSSDPYVVHFDRWWNPAIENQATDRAFRIGQERNVLVHKFVTRGTVEEKIDEMIREKQAVADAILEGGGETALTEMSDEEIIGMVTLDIGRAGAE